MDFQQSRTYANLQTAYNTELITSTQYEIDSDIARREGYIEISNIFNTTADQEKSHAVIWLQTLNNGNTPTTEQNLTNAAQYESYVADVMYREFARIALEEGYTDIAALFNGVANIELIHEAEFNNLLVNVTNNQVFCKSDEVLWICINCGNVLSGICAPEICPVCRFPQGYYKVFTNSNL
jgi:rubrerythrin